MQGADNPLSQEDFDAAVSIAHVFSQIAGQLQMQNNQALLGALYFACVVGFTSREDHVTVEVLTTSMEKSIKPLIDYVELVAAAENGKLN